MQPICMVTDHHDQNEVEEVYSSHKIIPNGKTSKLVKSITHSYVVTFLSRR